MYKYFRLVSKIVPFWHFYEVMSGFYKIILYNLYLYIVIKDDGSPRQHTATTLYFVVIDVDDAPPKFVDSSCDQKCVTCERTSYDGNVTYQNKVHFMMNVFKRSLRVYWNVYNRACGKSTSTVMTVYSDFLNKKKIKK